jgi:hypothetical protein
MQLSGAGYDSNCGIWAASGAAAVQACWDDQQQPCGGECQGMQVTQVGTPNPVQCNIANASCTSVGFDMDGTWIPSKSPTGQAAPFNAGGGEGWDFGVDVTCNNGYVFNGDFSSPACVAAPAVLVTPAPSTPGGAAAPAASLGLESAPAAASSSCGCSDKSGMPWWVWAVIGGAAGYAAHEAKTKRKDRSN